MLQTTDGDARRLYLSLLHGTARAPIRGILNQLLEANGMGALEIIYNDGKAEGKAEGRAEGEALALLRILRQRNLKVGPAEEARIRDNRDFDSFERWFARALTATSVDEILAD